MTHETADRSARKWKSTGTVTGSESTEESSSSTNSFNQPRYIKHTSTPVKSKRSSSRSNNRSSRSNVEDTEENELSGTRKRARTTRTKDRRSNYGSSHVTEERRKRYSGPRRKRRQEDRSQLEDEKRRAASNSSFPERRHSSVDSTKKLEKKKSPSQEWEDEVPITEILKRAREPLQTKYENPTPLPELTTDKIYIQGRDGFNVVKVAATKGVREEKGGTGMKRELGIVEGECYPPIRVAVVAQKFWKSTGHVYQGILAGMALMHFIMLHVFFDGTVEFVKHYSTISEIYATVSSFLITLCTLAIFDKFDLARFSLQHIREVYTEHGKSLIVIPLHLIMFGLHQFSLKTEDLLALTQFTKLNGSTVENTTKLAPLLEELHSWQKVTISKDLLAVCAWLFVSLGKKEDAFLSHLQSMEKYVNEEASE